MIDESIDNHVLISRAAAVLAEPTRMEILLVLMDGRSFPAGELAARTHISSSTASHHLAVLIAAGFVAVVQQGRHRYHRLANPGVAEAIESLGLVAGRPCGQMGSRPSQQKISGGRSCYNHLAGKLGVHLRQSLEYQGLIRCVGESYEVTDKGGTFLAGFGCANRMPSSPLFQTDSRSARSGLLAISEPPSPHPPPSKEGRGGPIGSSQNIRTACQHEKLDGINLPLGGKACLDWTERVPHIGGELGRFLFQALLEKGWIVRGDIPRQVLLTDVGASRFFDRFPV